jgi:cytosine/adenosine deaminase-related metal-dependent hydrolase
MIQNGIVAVGDICNNILTIPQKQKQRLAYYNFVELSGWLPNVAQIRFNRSYEFFQAFEQLKIQNSKLKTSQQLQTPPGSAGTKLQTSLSPHAPYSVSNELWNLISPYFKGNSVTIHNQETNFEDLLFQKGEGDFTRMYRMMQMDTSFFHPTGKTSLRSYFSKMANAKRVLLVHDTFTSEDDILFVNRESSDVSWCICINANQYIEQAVPPIDILRKHHTEIVIGTDSLASNWSLNILDEMKTIQQFFPHIELKEILQWATKNGAVALQMEDSLGTFEKGKQPGVVLFENINETYFQSNTTIKKLV